MDPETRIAEIVCELVREETEAEHERRRLVSAPAALEFRPDSKGRFDEIVARFADGMVHAEMMSNKALYIGLYWDDGRVCQVWISSDKKLTVHHEDCISDPPRFTAQGVDRGPQTGGGA